MQLDISYILLFCALVTVIDEGDPSRYNKSGMYLVIISYVADFVS